ncbi:M24 family metallopeptidase [Rhizobium mongolense]|uniref:M24 family metallopeptidase n=1 Tax=Rhizobium mongolense TaxID=57676 RepID=UPI0034A55B8C
MTNVDLSFTIEEYQSRLLKVRQHMHALNVDAVIIDEIEAMTWLSGYGVEETLWRCCCVLKEGEPFLLVRDLDIAPARERSWLSEIIGFLDWDEPVDVLAQELRKRGVGAARIAVDFDSHSMTLARFDRIKKALPDADFVDLGKFTWETRLVKSPAEISYLQKAADVADQAMVRAVKAVRVGATERDVSAAAAAAYLEFGADDAYVGPVTSGTGWDFLHGHTHSHSLEPGAIVHVELIPAVRGYTSRLMRSVVIGEATPEQTKVASTLAALQDRQIAAMLPGAKARDVDAVLREGIIAHSLRESFNNITGYTLGLWPPCTQRASDFTRTFNPAADWVVQPNTVFHMYVSAEGLAFSETVLVTESGPRRLTRTPRVLYSTQDS